MQTQFSQAQLATSEIADANKILRSCVHCGFCTATCPTYVTLGDELDSPRGRIYLIKELLESDLPPSEQVVTHLDRCLSCLSCTTTCPSGVQYGRLIDIGRSRVERTFERKMSERLIRRLLKWFLPYPKRFRLALLGGFALRMVAPFLKGRLAAMARLLPNRTAGPETTESASIYRPEGEVKGRVALLAGCVQQVIDPEINLATIRLLNRHGIEVVVSKGAGCCGALEHHLGDEKAAVQRAAANVDAWTRETHNDMFDAIIVNASGCGTQVKEYGHLLRGDSFRRNRANTVAARARDVTEFLDAMGMMQPRRVTGLAVAYHSACSLQHGQKVTEAPRRLLRQAGFEVREIAEGHLCCGSAGTYNIMQPDLATALKDRKLGHIRETGARMVAAGNIGCITQLQTAEIPVVHTVQLLDWATGGPRPPGLPDFERERINPALR